MPFTVDQMPAHTRFAFSPELIGTTREGFKARAYAVQNGAGYSNQMPVNSKYAQAWDIGAAVADVALGVSTDTPAFQRAIRAALAS